MKKLTTFFSVNTMIALSLTLAVASVILSAVPAEAQTVEKCGQHEIVAQHLTDNFGESVQAIALSDTNHLLEVYVSEGGETWTVTYSSPDGPTCIVAAGTNWEFASDPEPPDDPT